LFSDIRTNWTPKITATGRDVSKICPAASSTSVIPAPVRWMPLILKDRQAAQGSLGTGTARAIRSNHGSQTMEEALKNTTYMQASTTYFGDGLSSHYHTPGGIPMTAYRPRGDASPARWLKVRRLNCPSVADHISKVTTAPGRNPTFEYMSRMNPNHDANSFGHIGADMVTLNAMLRIPIDFHNLAPEKCFRPTMWDRFGGDDFRACKELGPLYV
jgi:L-fucose isomerase